VQDNGFYRGINTGAPDRHSGPSERLLDVLDAETALAWVNEIAPDQAPSFAMDAHPERPE
jgi:hypothetical protein